MLSVLTPYPFFVGGHADPSLWTKEQLCAIRGALWTARCPLPYGPRPGRPDNILAMDFYEEFDAIDRRRMLADYGPKSSRRYTHGGTGPLVGEGYHGQYPAYDWRDPAKFETYLDRMQEWWDGGVCPVHFCKPDGWSLADLETLTPLYLQPRAQRLLRVVVPCGWEPDRSTRSADYVAWLQWGARVFPNAVRLLHMVADHDAPGVGGEAPNDELWRRCIGYLHGWLVQNEAFDDPTPQNFKNFRDQFDINARGSLMDRFHNGYAGWPTTCADPRPLRVYAGEFASYWCYWKNRPEAEAQRWGSAALAAGADGVLDGCS